MNKESIYWMTLAHDLPMWSFSNKEGWKNEDKNNLIIKFFHENKISIEDFFQLPATVWKNDYQLSDKQINDLIQAKNILPNNAFMVENLFNSGIEIIPLVSPEYSQTLKTNLKKSAPTVLYVKGNKQIMSEKSIAIVGSRDASETALQFTDNIAKLASKEYKVVVSGFARGVDKQALDSAIAYKGQSIIVLPQGITTFGSGLKTYYKQIIDGDILVLSIFSPKAGWNAGLAMARNTIIYGLASEIYVAESSDKGGTWGGVNDGLKKGRKIYVRKPEISEKNANNILIQKGAVPVDFNGKELLNEIVVNIENNHDLFESKIRAALVDKPLTAKELLAKLDSDLTPQKLSAKLKNLDFIETEKKGQTNLYKLKGQKVIQQAKLF
jgi:predicted Rossmann fold nucleotide-binding protein DprA/Smf involved in DNA uptake